MFAGYSKYVSSIITDLYPIFTALTDELCKLPNDNCSVGREFGNRRRERFSAEFCGKQVSTMFVQPSVIVSGRVVSAFVFVNPRIRDLIVPQVADLIRTQAKESKGQRLTTEKSTDSYRYSGCLSSSVRRGATRSSATRAIPPLSVPVAAAGAGTSQEVGLIFFGEPKGTNGSGEVPLGFHARGSASGTAESRLD
jgi:hypothetical protein